MNVFATPVGRTLPVSTPREATNVLASKDLLETPSRLALTLMNALLRGIPVDPTLFAEIQTLGLFVSVPLDLVETEMLPVKLQKSELSVNPTSTAQTTLSVKTGNVSVDQDLLLLALSV